MCSRVQLSPTPRRTLLMAVRTLALSLALLAAGSDAVNSTRTNAKDKVGNHVAVTKSSSHKPTGEAFRISARSNVSTAYWSPQPNERQPTGLPEFGLFEYVLPNGSMVPVKPALRRATFEDDRTTKVHIDYYNYKYMDISVKRTKQTTVILMQQMMYSTQNRLRALRNITQKYSYHMTYKMALIYCKLKTLRQDIHAIYSMSRNNDVSGFSFNSHLVLYQHALRKNIDITNIVEYVVLLHAENVEKARAAKMRGTTLSIMQKIAGLEPRDRAKLGIP